MRIEIWSDNESLSLDGITAIENVGDLKLNNYLDRASLFVMIANAINDMRITEQSAERRLIEKDEEDLK